jgi:DNA-binding NtrC family response regulator
VSANGQRSEASNRKAGWKILLIDDRPEVASAMEIAFRLAGHSLTVAHEPEEGFSQLARTRFDAIVLDLNFAPGKTDGREGLACLNRIMADDPGACVVVLTAHGGVRMAVTAMQAGARDFAVKPWNNGDLIARVEAAIAREPVATSTGTGTGTQATDRSGPPARILGESGPIEELRQLIRRVGPSTAGVTITGPSGAGRMLAARAVHAASADAGNAPLLIDLREKGAIERIADAAGSVILRYPDRLDELAQDRLSGQLSEHVRPIAIADRLDALAPALRRRIATIELRVPALAHRRTDIPILARHFLTLAAERFGRPAPHLTEAAKTALSEADWPDEVRGLAAEMERALLLWDDGPMDTGSLSVGAPPIGAAVGAANAAEDSTPSFDLDRTEKALIVAALAEQHHNVSHAAKALGLSRGALYRRMERHGL